MGFCPNSRIYRPAGKVRGYLAVNAGFICKILCFEVLKYFSVNWLTGCSKIKAFMNDKSFPLCQESVPLAHIFGLTSQEWFFFLAELEFRENTGL